MTEGKNADTQATDKNVCPKCARVFKEEDIFCTERVSLVNDEVQQIFIALEKSAITKKKAMLYPIIAAVAVVLVLAVIVGWFYYNNHQYLIPVMVGNKWGYINKTGKIVI